MLHKLQDEIKNLELAEKPALAEKANSWNWKHITSMILTGVAVGLTIAVVLAPPVALAIASIVQLPYQLQ